MIAPPKPPSHDEREALIKEARARQLRRRLLGAASMAMADLTANITLRFGDGVRVTARQVPGQPPCMDRAGPSVLTVSRLLTPS
jgi:hypothetical protein